MIIHSLYPRYSFTIIHLGQWSIFCLSKVGFSHLNRLIEMPLLKLYLINRSEMQNSNRFTLIFSFVSLSSFNSTIHFLITLSGASEFTPVFCEVRVIISFFVFLFLFCWLWDCLSVDVRILITSFDIFNIKLKLVHCTKQTSLASFVFVNRTKY